MRSTSGLRVVALLCLLLLGAAGCWSYTDVITPAEAGDEEQGFGAAAHTKVAYMVLAAMVQRQTTIAHNASVVDGSDAFWRVYDGGSHLEFCERMGGAERCFEATLDGQELPGGWITTYVVVDPFNLGSMFIETQTSGGNQSTYSAVGAVLLTDEKIPATKNRGLWITGMSGFIHCRADGKGAPCNTVTLPEGASLLFPRILGMFVMNGEDVLWIASGGEVYRCVARGDQPATCQLAQKS
jgi:hypothetical protein